MSDILHQAVIEVDEKGTKAAAATAVVLMKCSLSFDPLDELTVDRPFYFAIHMKDHRPTFQGICNQP